MIGGSQMPNIVVDYSANIINIFNDVAKSYESNLEIIKQTEDEINDINHEIESSPPKDMYHGYLMYKTLRDLRVKRRFAKDENEILSEMYDYITSRTGVEVKVKMQKLQGHAVETERKLNNRSYCPRQRSDLTITDVSSVCNKPFEQLLKEFKETKVTTKNGKLRK